MGMAVGVKWAQATSERRSISDSVSHGHGVKHGEPSRLFQEGVTAIPCDSQRNTAWSRIDALFGVLPIHLFAPPTVASLAAACCWCPEHSSACCRARPSHCCSWPSASWCSSTTVFRRESHSDNVPCKDPLAKQHSFGETG